MLDQAKLDWAVLYKLYQHCESGGEALQTPDLVTLIDFPIPLRRVEIALKSLDSRGDVENEYHPYYPDGLWQISRQGLEKVERLIRSETTFVGRLHRFGDKWLGSDEAYKASLSAISTSLITEPVPSTKSFVDDNTTKSKPLKPRRVNGRPSLDWTQLGTILTGAGIIVSILLWWLSK